MEKSRSVFGGDHTGEGLLSIDWDYFIEAQKNWGSYTENKRTIIDLWYKRYLQLKAQGKSLQKLFRLSLNVDRFWGKINSLFYFEKEIKVYVSDSHALSYEIAKKNRIKTVYLFDAHADLGYGGFPSLNFEVNCANWLGKLLKDKLIHDTKIIYSPFSTEKPKDFTSINKTYNVQYPSLYDLSQGIKISAIHICRSGAWTPPWFDVRFAQFINALGIPYKIIDCPARKWDTQNISFSDQINYLMA